ncbi:hypothetical protein AB0B45_27160 [Nonomuraea sp. NPDC049152]|uniref:hypothetical protein n=1 Tax=Nonomuraea sp. NPDC049152 TaxID=3154350 RepID=UPI0033F7FDA0
MTCLLADHEAAPDDATLVLHGPFAGTEAGVDQRDQRGAHAADDQHAHHQHQDEFRRHED